MVLSNFFSFHDKIYPMDSSANTTCQSCKQGWISLCFTKPIIEQCHSKKHHVHALWICNSQAYRKMCLAKMNYVCTPCSLRDSLVSISGMLEKRPLKVADPPYMFCLRVCHWATMERMSAGQSLTRLPLRPRTSHDPWG